MRKLMIPIGIFGFALCCSAWFFYVDEFSLNKWTFGAVSAIGILLLMFIATVLKKQKKLGEYETSFSLISNLFQIFAFLIAAFLLLDSKVINNWFNEETRLVEGMAYVYKNRNFQTLSEGDQVELVVYLHLDDKDETKRDSFNLAFQGGIINHHVSFNSDYKSYSLAIKKPEFSIFRIAPTIRGVQFEIGQQEFYISPILSRKKVP